MAGCLLIETAPPCITLVTPEIPLAFATEVADGGPQTAIYVPPGVDASCGKLNVIFWLHGHKDAANKTLVAYLKDSRFKFRELLAEHAAGPSAVFIAPMLGPRDECGTLATDTQGYLDRVQATMIQKLGFPFTVGWSELVLACHSGGGKPLRAIVGSADRWMATQGGRLAEIWHFDSLYENEAQTPEDPEPTAAWWARWAARHPDTLIKVFHLTTSPHSEYLAKEATVRGLRNVSVVPSADKDHGTVARTYFPRCYEEWKASLTGASQART